MLVLGMFDGRNEGGFQKVDCVETVAVCVGESGGESRKVFRRKADFIQVGMHEPIRLETGGELLFAFYNGTKIKNLSAWQTLD